jgi:hypothetical protein
VEGGGGGSSMKSKMVESEEADDTIGCTGKD